MIVTQIILAGSLIGNLRLAEPGPRVSETDR